VKDTRPQWVLPLAGTCAICEQAARRMSVYTDHRVIVHTNPMLRPCVIPNPPAPVHGPYGYQERFGRRAA
jgi:hypothetical protein